MKKEFKFIELDKTVLPKTKGKSVDGFRFYDINGKAYPSVTTVLGILKKKAYKSGEMQLVKRLLNGKWVERLVEVKQPIL